MITVIGIIVAYLLVGVIAGTWAWLDQEFPGESYWHHVGVFLMWGMGLFIMLKDWTDTSD